MKKLMYYAGIMIAVVILLPLFIVRGCGHPAERKPPDTAITGSKIKISVFHADSKKSAVMDLEEYIKGVVAAEMPADFNIEALKAQAVAARTFAYGRLTGVYESKPGLHDGIDICTDSAHCQAWESKKDALKKWSIFFAARNWNKIDRAVNETKGLIVVYKGSIANTLFHASSAGRTENSEDVWQGVAVPYLRSVESTGEEDSRGYMTSVTIEKDEFLKKLQKAYPKNKIGKEVFKSIQVLEKTTGGRVKTLKVGNIKMKGTEFRSLFQLRSAAFDIEEDGSDSLRITTTGYGHGVGMSQWGADSLAKKGGTCVEILKHYYTGVDIVSIPEYANNP